MRAESACAMDGQCILAKRSFAGHRKPRVCNVALLALIEHNPKLTRKEMPAKTGLGPAGIEHSISSLIAAKRIEWVGPSRGGQWRVLAQVLLEGDGVSDLRRLACTLLIGLVLFTQFAWAAQSGLVLNARNAGAIGFGTKMGRDWAW